MKLGRDRTSDPRLPKKIKLIVQAGNRMVEIDPEDRKRWVEKFEKTTEEVVRQRISSSGYQAGDKAAQKRQAVFDWLSEKAAQRQKLATRRFHMIFWVAVASLAVGLTSWWFR